MTVKYTWPLGSFGIPNLPQFLRLDESADLSENEKSFNKNVHTIQSTIPSASAQYLLNPPSVPAESSFHRAHHYN